MWFNKKKGSTYWPGPAYDNLWMKKLRVVVGMEANLAGEQLNELLAYKSSLMQLQNSLDILLLLMVQGAFVHPK